MTLFGFGFSLTVLGYTVSGSGAVEREPDRR